MVHVTTANNPPNAISKPLGKTLANCPAVLLRADVLKALGRQSDGQGDFCDCPGRARLDAAAPRQNSCCPDRTFKLAVMEERSGQVREEVQGRSDDAVAATGERVWDVVQQEIGMSFAEPDGGKARRCHSYRGTTSGSKIGTCSIKTNPTSPACST